MWDYFVRTNSNITNVNTSNLTGNVRLNQYRVSLNTLPQAGAYISYMLSLSQIKSTRILSSSLIRRSANRYHDDTYSITTIFSLAPYELYDNQLQCV